jgi:hypothetical protein
MRRTTIRILALSLALLALAAPAAMARPAQDPPASVQNTAAVPSPATEDGTDWTTLGLVGGIVLVALGAGAGIGGAHLRRRHATA